MQVLAILETDLYDTVNEFKIYIMITVNLYDSSSHGGFLIGQKSWLYLGFGCTTLWMWVSWTGPILGQRLLHYSRLKWMRVLYKAFVGGCKEESRQKML